MKFIEKNLLENEKLEYQTKLHWIIFSGPLFFFILALVFFAQRDLLVLLGYLSLLVAIVTLLSSIIKYITSEFAVTNKRVILKIGFIQRQSWEILLNKIAAIEVDQNILGRMLGYGNIIIQSTGGGKDRFTSISDPLQFRRKVQEKIEAFER